MPDFSIQYDATDATLIHLPAPRAAIRHAIPVVLEATVAPIVLFYVVLTLGGFHAALIAAFVWSLGAAIRRVVRGERVSTLLILGVVLLALRTVVTFATGSAFVYFAQPLAGTVCISLILFASAAMRRPFTQRFAHDFCPLDPELLAQPRVQQFFVWISWMWASVLLINSGLVLWLLLSSSLRTFVLERTVITWALTGGAIACSIWGFVATMRKDGATVLWGARRHVGLAEVPNAA